MRKPFVAGNWKMNLTLAQGRQLLTDVASGLAKTDAQARVDVAICPPTVYVQPLAAAAAGGPVAVGAQDVYHEASGAFTGETAPAMLKEVGSKYVIIGHSERRHTIGHLEDDRMINLKVRAAKGAGLVPILCIGETLAERQASLTLDVLTFQLTANLVGFKPAGGLDLVIAYEPVWAIGTGQVATPEQAQEAHAHCRAELRRLLGSVAEEIRILYGGSVKADNAAAIFSKPDVDGGLIGGASLKAESFLGIIKAAVETAG